MLPQGLLLLIWLSVRLISALNISTCYCESVLGLRLVFQATSESRLCKQFILLTFPIIKIPENFLWRHKQVNHLPRREFEVHLVKLEQSSQILVSLHCRTGSGGLVVGRSWQGRRTPRIVAETWCRRRWVFHHGFCGLFFYREHINNRTSTSTRLSLVLDMIYQFNSFILANYKENKNFCDYSRNVNN